MKKILFITPLITILLIVSAIFINNIAKDNKETKERILTIEKTYQELKQNTEDYNNIRTKLSEDNIYYQNNFLDSYNKIITELNEYDEIINKINNNINIINTNCKGRLYNDKETNNICSKYKKTYEQMINIYLNDIESTNNIIESYNKENDNKLETFKSKYIFDYIDYDKDGIYLEKNQ